MLLGINKPGVSASSTVRQCLVITSCPPFLVTTMLMIIGLLLLFEEIALVSTVHKQEILEEESSNVIYGKRISNFWKAEDFIVQKRPLRLSERNTDFKSKESEESIRKLDQKLRSPLEQNQPHKKGIDYWEERSKEKEAVILSDDRDNDQSKMLDNDVVRMNDVINAQRGTNKSAIQSAPKNDTITTNSYQTTSLVVSKSEQDVKVKVNRELSLSKGVQRKKSDIRRKDGTSKSRPRGKHQVNRGNTLGDDNGYFVASNKHRSKLHDNIVNRFKLNKDVPRDSFINLHRYGYILDSQACSIGNPKFAILIHSKFNNFIKRAKIRNTFAKNKTVSGVQFVVIFVLGMPDMESLDAEIPSSHDNAETKKKKLAVMKERIYEDTMHKLEVESQIFKDIVMGNFTDSYRNLTIKHLLAYHWLLKRCKSPTFVLKVDDDILVNTYRIARLVKQATNTSDSRGILICDVPEKQRVIRADHNKWFVSEQEYPFRFYPPWCKGYGVFMTRDVVRKLYTASSDMRNFWIDDVYVTGILAWRAGIKVRNFRHKYSTITHRKFKPNDIHSMFVMTKFAKNRSHRAYWNAMVAAQENL